MNLRIVKGGNMEYCRKSQRSKMARYSSLYIIPSFIILLTVVGILSIILGIIDSSHLAQSLLTSLIISLFVVFLIRYGYKSYLFETRKFCITNNGIILGNKNNKLYTWNEIVDIYVIAFAATTPSSQNYETVICCFFKPPQKEFLSKILCSYRLGIENYNNFVIIEYDQKILDKLNDVYKKEIVDYRRKQLGFEFK